MRQTPIELEDDDIDPPLDPETVRRERRWLGRISVAATLILTICGLYAWLWEPRQHAQITGQIFLAALVQHGHADVGA